METELLEIIKANSKPMNPLGTGLSTSTTPLKNIKSVIFDIYGTLLQSASGDIGTSKKQSKNKYFIKALKQCGVNILNSDAGMSGLKLFYKEITLSHKRSKTKGILYPEVVITEIWESVLYSLKKSKLIDFENINIRKFALLFESMVNPVWPMPQLRETIQNLQSRNIITGIISNAQFYTPLLFEALLGSTLEEMGFNSELIEYSFLNGEAKPSAKMFKKIQNNLLINFNISSGNTLYVGNDMLNDVYSAKKEGLKTALFAGDLKSLRLRSDIPGLLDEKPDIVITELNNIAELLE